MNGARGLSFAVELPPMDLKLSRVGSAGSASVKPSVTDGASVLPFFAVEAVRKAVKRFDVKAGRPEVLVIAGRKSLTDCMVYNLSAGVHFLTVLDSLNDIAVYGGITDAVYGEFGLPVSVLGEAFGAVRNADIIFNLSDGIDNALDYAFKRNAVLFDILGSGETRARRKRKRDDLNIIDGVIINVFGEKMPINVFDLALFIKSKDYRLLCANGFDSVRAGVVNRQVRGLNAAVSSFSITRRK